MLLYSPPTSSSSELNSFSNIFHDFLLGSIFFRLPTHCFTALQTSSFSRQPQSCCHDLHSSQVHTCGSLTRHKFGRSSACFFILFIKTGIPLQSLVALEMGSFIDFPFLHQKLLSPVFNRDH